MSRYTVILRELVQAEREFTQTKDIRVSIEEEVLVPIFMISEKQPIK